MPRNIQLASAREGEDRVSLTRLHAAPGGEQYCGAVPIARGVQAPFMQVNPCRVQRIPGACRPCVRCRPESTRARGPGTTAGGTGNGMSRW